MVKDKLKECPVTVMNFYIGVSAVISFLCWVLYFQHTVEYGRGRRRSKNETHVRFHRGSS